MSDKMTAVYEKCSRFGAPVCFQGWPDYFTYFIGNKQIDYTERSEFLTNEHPFDITLLNTYHSPTDYYDFSQFKLYKALYDK